MAQANQVAALVVAGIVVDVVNIDSGLDAPLALALRAKRLLSQHQTPQALPCCPVEC